MAAYRNEFEGWWEAVYVPKHAGYSGTRDAAELAWKAATVAAMSDVKAIIRATIEEMYPSGIITHPKMELDPSIASQMVERFERGRIVILPDGMVFKRQDDPGPSDGVIVEEKQRE